jgi:hypothetical protein
MKVKIEINVQLLFKHEGKDISNSKQTQIQYNLQLHQKEIFTDTIAFSNFN